MLFRPLAIRRNVSPDRRGRDTPGSQKAQSAIRCIKTNLRVFFRRAVLVVRKHRAPNGALRLHHEREHGADTPRRVIKHRAPNGALRRSSSSLLRISALVIKHRAPNGALRHDILLRVNVLERVRHKAPSAKRCIKTGDERADSHDSKPGHKAPSAKRCIKTRDDQHTRPGGRNMS